MLTEKQKAVANAIASLIAKANQPKVSVHYDEKLNFTSIELWLQVLFDDCIINVNFYGELKGRVSVSADPAHAAVLLAQVDDKDYAITLSGDTYQLNQKWQLKRQWDWNSYDKTWSSNSYELALLFLLDGHMYDPDSVKRQFIERFSQTHELLQPYL